MRNADRTAIGVDVGEYNLYTASPVKMPDSRGAVAVCGEEICARLDEFRERVTGCSTRKQNAKRSSRT